jgi:hypothetical protein
MNRTWTVCRQYSPRQDGERRWDQAPPAGAAQLRLAVREGVRPLAATLLLVRAGHARGLTPVRRLCRERVGVGSIRLAARIGGRPLEAPAVYLVF